MNIQAILKNIEHTHYTTTEIEEKYGIKSATIRSYISRDKVIPTSKSIKVGNQWYIEKQFADILWGKKQEDLLYLVEDYDGRADEYVTAYDTLEEANDAALEAWAGYSRNIKKTARVYVIAVKQEDYLKVQNNETEAWYDDFEVDIEGDRFNSNLANGYGEDQETAYLIFDGNESLEEEIIYDTLEDAKARVKELYEKYGKFYAAVEIGKKDAELVFKHLTDKIILDFIEDLDGIYSTDDLAE